MTRHVLLIGIDGLRIDDTLAGTYAPTLTGFCTTGAFADMQMPVPTISGPEWSTILTGASHAEHGVYDNTFHGNRLLNYPDFLSRAWFRDQSMTTWAATSWLPLADPRGPGPVIWWRDEAHRAGRHHVLLRDGETRGYQDADGDVTAWSVMVLRDGGPRASFVYLGQVDLAGHVFGGISPEYRTAVSTVDAHVATLLSTVQGRVAEHRDEDWLVVITTDHGHLDQGGHGGADPVLRRSFVAAQRIVTAQSGSVEVQVPQLPNQMDPADVTPYLLGELFADS